MLASLILSAALAAAPGRSVQAETAEELLKAIAPGVTIELTGSDYNLYEVQEFESAYVKWVQETPDDTAQITIRGVYGLTIMTKGDIPSRLLASPRDVFVLAFEDCTKVELNGLVLGHNPEGGECFDGVIYAKNCRDLGIYDSDLFGCGTTGLNLDNVNGLIFDHSTIRNCNSSIMNVYDSKNLKFSDSTFFQNGADSGFDFNGCTGVDFEDCIVHDNNAGGSSLFNVYRTEDVHFLRGNISGNSGAGLVSLPNVMVFEGVDISKALVGSGD